MLIIICIETAFICFMLFGFYLNFRHFRPKFKSFMPPMYSKEIVYETFNFSDNQKSEYDKLVVKYISINKSYFMKHRELMKKLHNVNMSANISSEESGKYAEEIGDILKARFVASNDFIREFKAILNDEQKQTFSGVMRNKELYKFMPNFGAQAGRLPAGKKGAGPHYGSHPKDQFNPNYKKGSVPSPHNKNTKQKI